MSDGEFIGLVIAGLMVAYVAGFTWGKYAKILKNLGTSA